MSPLKPPVMVTPPPSGPGSLPDARATMAQQAWAAYRHELARDFAKILLTSDLANPIGDHYPRGMAEFAYTLADAMIEAGK